MSGPMFRRSRYAGPSIKLRDPDTLEEKILLHVWASNGKTTTEDLAANSQAWFGVSRDKFETAMMCLFMEDLVSVSRLFFASITVAGLCRLHGEPFVEFELPV